MKLDMNILSSVATSAFRNDIIDAENFEVGVPQP
jgi:hypothetical protein